MIIGVALRRREDGQLFKLPKPNRHCHLFWEANERFRWNVDQGFYDENGKFYDRREAAAHVLEAGQELSEYAKVEYRDRKIEILFSEDVW